MSAKNTALIILAFLMVAVGGYFLFGKNSLETYRSKELGFEVACPRGTWQEENVEDFWPSLLLLLTCAQEKTAKKGFISLAVRNLHDVLPEQIQCFQTTELLPAVVLGKQTINNINFCKLEEDSEGDHFLSYIASNGVLAYEIMLANKYLIPANTPSGNELGGFLTPEEFEQHANGFFKEVVSSFRFLNPPFNPRD